MNRRNAGALRNALEELRPDADVEVTPEPDGASVHISGSEKGEGVSGPGTALNTCLSMSDDGPLARFLRNGHLH